MADGGRLEGRLALVTGASRGLGAAVAKRYAAEGAHVVLLARTQGALEEVDDAIKAAGGQSTLVVLDLAKADDIDRMGMALYQRFGKLDILVGAAATLHGLSPVGHYAPKDWDAVWAVNLTANWRLIRGFDPLLRAAPAGRAIFVTCAQAREARPYWSAYAASKAALESMTLTWAAEIAKVTGVKVNLVDPGPMATRLRLEAFPGEDRSALRAPEDAADIFVDLAAADCARHGQIVKA